MRDGTAAHWVAEQILRSFTVQDAAILVSDDIVGNPAPNGVVATDEMWNAAMIYVNDILEVCNAHGLLRQLHIEEPVAIPQVHELCWGTPDCWVFDNKTGVLYIWDFKYGHLRVEAFENWQMICYMLGVLGVIDPVCPLLENGIKVDCRVVQPRCYDGRDSIREWRVMASDLRPHMNILFHAAHDALSADAKCNPGPWCGYCPAAGSCPALQTSVAGIIDHSADPIPQSLSDEGLAYEMKTIANAERQLKARRDALEADAEHRVRAGGILPGWRMEQRYGHNKWNDLSLIASMGPMIGVDLMKAPEPLTPAKAIERLRQNKVDPIVIDGLYSKSPTSLKMVQDDGSKARQVFSKGGF